jgi:hypothetical protein
LVTDATAFWARLSLWGAKVHKRRTFSYSGTSTPKTPLWPGAARGRGAWPVLAGCFLAPGDGTTRPQERAGLGSTGVESICQDSGQAEFVPRGATLAALDRLSDAVRVEVGTEGAVVQSRIPHAHHILDDPVSFRPFGRDLAVFAGASATGWPKRNPKLEIVNEYGRFLQFRPPTVDTAKIVKGSVAGNDSTSPAKWQASASIRPVPLWQIPARRSSRFPTALVSPTPTRPLLSRRLSG